MDFYKTSVSGGGSLAINLVHRPDHARGYSRLLNHYNRSPGCYGGWNHGFEYQEALVLHAILEPESPCLGSC